MSFHPDARSQPAALPKNQILQINGILIQKSPGNVEFPGDFAV